MGLIKTNKVLNSLYTALALNEATNKVEWVDREGHHSIDVMTFCCEEIVDRLSILLTKVKASIAELPGFSSLYQMVMTDNTEYVEQMRGIISCV